MKNLLIITAWFPSENWDIPSTTFVKDYVDSIKFDFDKISIISPTPYFPKFLSKIDKIPHFFRQQSLFEDYSYDNVEIYFPKYLTVPIKFFREKNGDFAYKVSKKCIEKNNIKFDLIHSHFTWVSWYVWVKLKNDYNKKLVTTGHWFDVYDLPFKNNFWKEKISYVLDNSDVITTVSKSNESYLKKLTDKDIKVIENWYDNNIFYKQDIDRKDLNINHDKKIILTVWRLVKIKNQKSLIYACKELIKKREDYIFYIIWDWELKNELQQEIDDNNLQDYIKLLWAKPHDNIPKYMNMADLFLLPSYSESFWVVNIEALACWTPVISTVNGWSEEIIIDDDYWYLLEGPDDYIWLLKLIDKWLDKNWDEEKIINYAKYNYSYDRIWKKYLEIYNDLI